MMKVVVVGAGPAGLAATYALKKKGVDVVTFERSDNAGGRALCVTKDGFTCDMGAQFLGKFYETTFRFCEELGMSRDIIPFNFKAATWRNGKFHVISDDTSAVNRLKALPGLFTGVPPMAMLQAARMGPRILRRLPAVLKVDFDRLRGVDHLSFADFVLKCGGKEALESIFQQFCAGLTLGEPEDIGTAHALSLFNFARGLLALRGGFGSLTDRLHEECSDEVRLSSRVKRVVLDGKAVKGVETDEGFVEADAVICATTAGVARDIIGDLPDGMRKALEKVRYSKCRHVCFCLEERLLPRGWYAGAIPRKAGSFLPAIVDSSEKSPDHTPRGAGQVHCFTYGRKASEYDDLPDGKLAELMIEEVRRFVPSMPGKPLFYLHCRWDEAICLEPPGMLAAMEALRSGDCGKVGGLYLAGSYMRLLSSVEGSLRSGEEAAMDALRYS